MNAAADVHHDAGTFAVDTHSPVLNSFRVEDYDPRNRFDPEDGQFAADLDKMRAIHELEAAYDAKLAAWPKGRPLPASLREVRWMLEELRVSQFAQGLGTRGPVSSKRIRRVLEEAASAA